MQPHTHAPIFALKPLAGLLALCACASPALAGEGVINPGPGLTMGAGLGVSSVYAGVFNPAVGSLLIAPEEAFRMAYAPSFATDVEVGQVDNFINDLNDLIDVIDDPEKMQQFGDTAKVQNRFNAALVKMGRDGYLVNSTSMHAPIMPFYWRLPVTDGTLMLDASLNTQVKVGVLDDIVIVKGGGIDTSTSLYLKGAIEKTFAAGYSQPLLDKPLAEEYGGQLYAGAKLSLYNIDLSKQTFLLMKLDGKDVENVMQDEYKRQLNSSTNAGLDVGLAWVGDGYRAGLTLLNINQPSFDYGQLGNNCLSRSENTVERANCESAASFTQRGTIKTYESHVKSARFLVDGEYRLLPGWTLNAAADLAAYDDLVGAQNQWVSLSTQYVPSIHWVPTARIGYQANLVGSELSALSLGLSFWGIVTLDAKMALDDVTVDGSSGPRSLGFSVSIAEAF